MEVRSRSVTTLVCRHRFFLEGVRPHAASLGARTRRKPREDAADLAASRGRAREPSRPRSHRARLSATARDGHAAISANASATEAPISAASRRQLPFGSGGDDAVALGVGAALDRHTRHLSVRLAFPERRHGGRSRSAATHRVRALKPQNAQFTARHLVLLLEHAAVEEGQVLVGRVEGVVKHGARAVRRLPARTRTRTDPRGVGLCRPVGNADSAGNAFGDDTAKTDRRATPRASRRRRRGPRRSRPGASDRGSSARRGRRVHRPDVTRSRRRPRHEIINAMYVLQFRWSARSSTATTSIWRALDAAVPHHALGLVQRKPPDLAATGVQSLSQASLSTTRGFWRPALDFRGRLQADVPAPINGF